MNYKPVEIWLKIGIVMIMLMVMIGGTTRLTGSGLSITEWKVIGGTIPPLSETEWQIAFEKYKQTPEFIIKNNTMKIESFKSIFFWEYLHRLWGRLMGFVFFIPFIIFWKKGYFQPKGLTGKMFVVMILGGLQGALGWFMVASGLVDVPEVSHFRLTAHLLMALLLLTYLLWLLNNIKFNLNKEDAKEKDDNFLSKSLQILLAIILLQLVYGGFMAGKKAAYFYPTYPTMNGQIIPDNLWANDGLSNLTENVTTIHFIHRLLPWMIVGLFVYILLKTKEKNNVYLQLKNNFLLIGTLLFIQIILGIITVLILDGKISVFWGTTHQIIGLKLFLSVWWLWLKTRRNFEC